MSCIMFVLGWSGRRDAWRIPYRLLIGDENWHVYDERIYAQHAEYVRTSNPICQSLVDRAALEAAAIANATKPSNEESWWRRKPTNHALVEHQLRTANSLSPLQPASPFLPASTSPGFGFRWGWGGPKRVSPQATCELVALSEASGGGLLMHAGKISPSPSAKCRAVEREVSASMSEAFEAITPTLGEGSKRSGCGSDTRSIPRVSRCD